MIRNRAFWISEIEIHFNVDTQKAEHIWMVVSHYLLNTRATAALALRSVSNLEYPGITKVDKELLTHLIK